MDLTPFKVSMVSISSSRALQISWGSAGTGGIAAILHKEPSVSPQLPVGHLSSLCPTEQEAWALKSDRPGVGSQLQDSLCGPGQLLGCPFVYKWNKDVSLSAALTCIGVSKSTHLAWPRYPTLFISFHFYTQGLSVQIRSGEQPGRWEKTMLPMIKPGSPPGG